MKKSSLSIIATLICAVAIFAVVTKKYGGSAEGTATVYQVYGGKALRSFSVSATEKCYHDTESDAKSRLKSSLESTAKTQSKYIAGIEEVRVSDIYYDIDTCNVD
ncbi:MAG: hypothetical protein HS105_05550 [Chloracidobacterium sp.]|nr:hypothetical protein [Chloracidobacterium sp.]